ncbi:unnamed protein product [Scytosiphon promiscuus]
MDLPPAAPAPLPLCGWPYIESVRLFFLIELKWPSYLLRTTCKSTSTPRQLRLAKMVDNPFGAFAFQQVRFTRICRVLGHLFGGCCRDPRSVIIASSCPRDVMLRDHRISCRDYPRPPSAFSRPLKSAGVSQHPHAGGSSTNFVRRNVHDSTRPDRETFFYLICPRHTPSAQSKMNSRLN